MIGILRRIFRSLKITFKTFVLTIIKSTYQHETGMSTQLPKTKNENLTADEQENFWWVRLVTYKYEHMANGNIQQPFSIRNVELTIALLNLSIRAHQWFFQFWQPVHRKSEMQFVGKTKLMIYRLLAFLSPSLNSSSTISMFLGGSSSNIRRPSYYEN